MLRSVDVSIALSFSLIFSACTAKETKGNAVSAREEITRVSKQVNEEKRYRLDEADLALLRQNGLLSEKSKLALDTLSKN